MSNASTTMTFRLDPQLKAKLGRLAEGIQRGMADVAAGRTVSHEEAMAAVQRAIAASGERA